MGHAAAPRLNGTTAGSRVRETLEMVRFSHTLFALPFALTGMLLAAGGLPTLQVVGWIAVAMVAARTAAMTFNRLMDRRFDATNPRTAGRALPAGRLTPAFAWGVFVVSVGLLVLAAERLSPLALGLTPLALVILCGYSLTKRFTVWTHLVLGLALSGAPLGAWIAVRGDVTPTPLLLASGVLLWTAGFDVIYALQDVEHDRRSGLGSLPARFGAAPALTLARLFHAMALALFAATGVVAGRGAVYQAGVALAGILMVYEHVLVGADDQSGLQIAFFRVNVAVSLILLIATFADLHLA